MFTPKSILVPTDFSEHSDRAVRQAVDIAEQHNSKIYLLHVVDRLQQCAIDYCIPQETMMKVQSDSEKEAAKKMREEAEKILKTKKHRPRLRREGRNSLRGDPEGATGAKGRPHRHRLPRPDGASENAHRFCGREGDARGEMPRSARPLRSAAARRIVELSPSFPGVVPAVSRSKNGGPSRARRFRRGSEPLRQPSSPPHRNSGRSRDPAGR